MREGTQERAEAMRAQGVAMAGGGDLGAAARALRDAIAASPEAGAGYRDLATVLAASGEWRQAAATYEKAVELGLEDARCYCAWARALLAAREPARALAVMREGCGRYPGDARARYYLGRVLYAQRRYREALQEIQEALELDDGFLEARRLFALGLEQIGYYARAKEEMLTYLKDRPDDTGARIRLVNLYWHRGELEQCRAECEALLRTGENPTYYESFQRVIQIHRHGETAESIRRKHSKWVETATLVQEPDGYTVEATDANRRLRIGFVANQLAKGPFFHFVTPLLRDHDRDGFAYYCYHTSAAADAYTDILKGYVEHFRHETDRDAVARLIKSDQIDILVDLSGHYGENLPLFLDRRAPLQVALPTEYPATSGLPSFDYILTDRWACAEGQEGQYTEPAWHLPRGYLTYNPPMAVAAGRLPARERGAVTFGLFQRPAKLNAAVWDAVAKVLHAVAGSTLLIHYGAAELECEESEGREHYREELKARGVKRDRVHFRGGAAMGEHLKILAEADIALDSFPYSGQTTTCECLWMGVPVVSLLGEVHVSRVGYAILRQVGLGHLAAATAEEYVALAAGLAADLGALEILRRELRERLLCSPMVNGDAVRGIEEAFRQMWQQRCGAATRGATRGPEGYGNVEKKKEARV